MKIPSQFIIHSYTIKVIQKELDILNTKDND